MNETDSKPNSLMRKTVQPVSKKAVISASSASLVKVPENPDASKEGADRKTAEIIDEKNAILDLKRAG